MPLPVLLDANARPSEYFTEEFPWHSFGSGDMICEIGDYLLLVEIMPRDCWRWALYYKTIKVHTEKNVTSPMCRAIGLAEGSYLGHTYAIKLKPSL